MIFHSLLLFFLLASLVFQFSSFPSFSSLFIHPTNNNKATTTTNSWLLWWVVCGLFLVHHRSSFEYSFIHHLSRAEIRYIISSPVLLFHIQQLNNSTTQQLNNSTTQQLNNSTTQQLNNSTTQQLNNSTTQQLNIHR